MIYLDASALVKLVREETETAALREYLAGYPTERPVASAVAWVEVPRAVAGHPSDVDAARSVMADVEQVPFDSMIMDSASTVEPPVLRSLDAIHLASALRLGEELTAFVAYDRRLLAAAEAVGMPVVSPS